MLFSVVTSLSVVTYILLLDYYSAKKNGLERPFVCTFYTQVFKMVLSSDWSVCVYVSCYIF